MEKTFTEMSRLIEKSHKVERCIVMQVAGRGFINHGGDIHIQCKDSHIFEEAMDSEKPIIQNDVKNNVTLAKELLRFFNLKVHNMMIIPIRHKK